ncbi:MAG TPA: hypothetical protein VM328_02010, partial [Fimbriimonadaceae bacterium]|nr:hypothetical protein [Fimbriimonadaceae bacterium]
MIALVATQSLLPPQLEASKGLSWLFADRVSRHAEGVRETDVFVGTADAKFVGGQVQITIVRSLRHTELEEERIPSPKDLLEEREVWSFSPSGRWSGIPGPLARVGRIVQPAPLPDTRVVPGFSWTGYEAPRP